ncbi:hypothetical protein V1525DRAFT_407195 [Lipomyces kononenkoae]|uniref:Uncharacterized protein n=1 Tax=Lipomyces kononenkoae TaxID=34357 RepID=A0ACC3T022_LIPKO
MSANWIQDVAARYRAATGSSRSVLSTARSQRSPQLIVSPFASEVRNLSRAPLVYEEQSLLDEALEILPLERLYSGAEQAAEKDDSWGMQDHLILALLKWFRNDFFTWVNEPACTNCLDSQTAAIGGAAPTHQELADGAARVELYECKSCKTIVRFPRYGHPRKLLSFRKGRCGEWANCFTLLCRSLGSRARWVWCAEDHVWTEVYSETKKRWIHADSCETAWDQPRLYEQGWGKKMSYAIAFSADGATDVSRRYIRTEGGQLPRNRIPESELVMTLQAITRERRIALSASEKADLEHEDSAEERELQSYVSQSTPASTAELRPRETGAGEWTEARGENGKRRY